MPKPYLDSQKTAVAKDRKRGSAALCAPPGSFMLPRRLRFLDMLQSEALAALFKPCVQAL